MRTLCRGSRHDILFMSRALLHFHRNIARVTGNVVRGTLQWVWVGSCEASFHESLQPAGIGLQILPKIITLPIFVLLWNKIKTFALAPNAQCQNTFSVLFLSAHIEWSRWNENICSALIQHFYIVCFMCNVSPDWVYNSTAFRFLFPPSSSPSLLSPFGEKSKNTIWKRIICTSSGSEIVWKTYNLRAKK